MIVGVGCDMLKMSSIIEESLKDGSAFVKKVYTHEEQLQAAMHTNPNLYFKVHFCGKEAVCKTFRLNGNCVRLNEIEILNDDNGAPYVNLYGALKSYAEKLDVSQIQVSLSYDGEYAMAYAIALAGRNQSC